MQASMPPRIDHYEERIAGTLTLRQLTALAITGAYAWALYTRSEWSKATRDVALLCGAPVFLGVGFLRYQGLTPERLFLTILRFVLQPQRRLYRHDLREEDTYDQVPSAMARKAFSSPMEPTHVSSHGSADPPLRYGLSRRRNSRRS